MPLQLPHEIEGIIVAGLPNWVVAVIAFACVFVAGLLIYWFWFRKKAKSKGDPEKTESLDDLFRRLDTYLSQREEPKKIAALYSRCAKALMETHGIPKASAMTSAEIKARAERLMFGGNDKKECFKMFDSCDRVLFADGALPYEAMQENVRSLKTYLKVDEVKKGV